MKSLSLQIIAILIFVFLYIVNIRIAMSYTLFLILCEVLYFISIKNKKCSGSHEDFKCKGINCTLKNICKRFTVVEKENVIDHCDIENRTGFISYEDKD